jgi:2-C-methyl-D-erythritol 4-phosphate cytidylyltransferase/2-C-methyl-D-erythritol 2,4-cyclodiphosphate synthase
MYVAAIIAAGGRGVRLGADRPKQFLQIQGSSLLELTVKVLAASNRIDEIVVALPEDHLDAVGRSFEGQIKQPLHFVAGGERRQDSVANAFAKTSLQADVVVVHDAARPFVTTDVIDRAIDGALEYGAAIAAVTVRDTVKQTGDANAQGSRRILATIPRDSVFLAQTPQAFARDVLARALAEGTLVDATDEAMLVERLGLPVHIVEGDPRNVKITTAADLAAAKAAALQTSMSRLEGDGFSRHLRIGTGYDLHRLVAGRPLILGGVTISFELGLDGHSDADIVCHAVTDAVLGAAGIGDIGRLFPDTDPKWKGADSIALLKGAITKVHDAGYRVSNVDVTVIAQKPKLLPYLELMRGNLAAALAVEPSAVSVKGKTNEGVESMGRSESMACHAVALLTS